MPHPTNRQPPPPASRLRTAVPVRHADIAHTCRSLATYPASTAARDAATAPPSMSARRSSRAKFSLDLRARPPATMTWRRRPGWVAVQGCGGSNYDVGRPCMFPGSATRLAVMGWWCVSLDDVTGAAKHPQRERTQASRNPKLSRLIHIRAPIHATRPHRTFALPRSGRPPASRPASPSQIGAAGAPCSAARAPAGTASIGAAASGRTAAALKLVGRAWRVPCGARGVGSGRGGRGPRERRPLAERLLARRLVPNCV
jgi:hypothetical protein